MRNAPVRLGIGRRKKINIGVRVDLLGAEILTKVKRERRTCSLHDMHEEEALDGLFTVVRGSCPQRRRLANSIGRSMFSLAAGAGATKKHLWTIARPAPSLSPRLCGLAPPIECVELTNAIPNRRASSMLGCRRFGGRHDDVFSGSIVSWRFSSE